MILILLVAFVFLQGTAEAKTVLGKVSTVDAIAKTLSVSNADPVTGVEEIVSVQVADTATFSGVSSLDQIQAGDEVQIEAEEEAVTGNLKATSIQVVKAPVVPAAPAEPAPM